MKPFAPILSMPMLPIPPWGALALLATLLTLPVCADLKFSNEEATTIGATLLSLWGLVKIADGLLNFYKRHIKQSIPSGSWVSEDQFRDFKGDVDIRLKEAAAYHHEEIHKLNNLVNEIRVSGDNGREGLHNRMGTIIEVVAELRGETKGMVLAAKTSAEAAQLAGQAANRAADRADEAVRHNNRG